MPADLKEVQEVIQEEFPGADVSDLGENNYRVTGTIVWDGFQNKDSWERNRMVTERVRDRLGMRGINIGLLFPRAFRGEK